MEGKTSIKEVKEVVMDVTAMAAVVSLAGAVIGVAVGYAYKRITQIRLDVVALKKAANP